MVTLSFIDSYQSCFYVLPDGEVASAQFFTIPMGWKVYWSIYWC